MICIAISAEDHSSAMEKSHKAIQNGADFIEIRVDHFKNPFNTDFAKLVQGIQSKLILTIRKTDEGGEFAFEENQRIELIKRAIDSRPYAVDLELSMDLSTLTALIAQAKQKDVRTILSYHDFQKTPDISKMKDIIVDATKKQADFVKIIGTAISIEDNLKFLSLPHFAKEHKIQIITFAMGSKGIISRILSPIFGAAFTFAALDKPTAPGQISIKEMKKNLETFTSYNRK
ncbi:MAG TPA: type I 3-dehydroquinate dehydratase [Candidatus Deferrimicrobium sp.]|nr:type I 3-dehydroquinate dehydratase [Candidatus Deferrimicrobium sp.]